MSLGLSAANAAPPATSAIARTAVARQRRKPGVMANSIRLQGFVRGVSPPPRASQSMPNLFYNESIIIPSAEHESQNLGLARRIYLLSQVGSRRRVIHLRLHRDSVPALRYPGPMLSPADQTPPPGSDDIFDATAVAAEMENVA